MYYIYFYSLIVKLNEALKGIIFSLYRVSLVYAPPFSSFWDTEFSFDSPFAFQILLLYLMLLFVFLINFLVFFLFNSVHYWSFFLIKSVHYWSSVHLIAMFWINSYFQKEKSMQFYYPPLMNLKKAISDYIRNLYIFYLSKIEFVKFILD